MISFFFSFGGSGDDFNFGIQYDNSRDKSKLYVSQKMEPWTRSLMHRIEHASESVSWIYKPIGSIYGVYIYIYIYLYMLCIYHKNRPHVGKLYHTWILLEGDQSILFGKPGYVAEVILVFKQAGSKR